MKVLLIDEADAIRPRLERQLGEIEGIHISSCAPSECDPLPRIRELRPNVIVVGIQIPGGALALIREIKSAAHPPVVIALSSSASIQYRAASHRAGADYFFDKIRELAQLGEALTVLKAELEAPDESWPTGE